MSTPEPSVLLAQMVIAYQTAVSYSDRATVRIIGKMSQPDTEPASWNCAVAFQKPNRLRLEIDEGIFVSDGKDIYAQIRQRPDLVLRRPAPERWTLEMLFQDVPLDNAMELGLPHSVLRFPPQLVLLFANHPLNTFCPKGASVEWLEQQQIAHVPCDVIQISHSDGNRILWISQEDHALLRLDYQPVGLPVPEGFDSIEVIRIEMTDAGFHWDYAGEALQTLQRKNVTYVTEFPFDTPGLLSPEEHRHRLKLMAESDTYRLIDQHIETIATREQPPPKVAPKTFSLSPIWTLPLDGVDTMALLSGVPTKLLIPCEGNLAATLDLLGNDLKKNPLEGLENSIVVDVQVSPSEDNRQIGILTLDFKLTLFDESFKPLPALTEQKIRCFRFIPHLEWLLLGIQENSAQDDATTTSVIRAVDGQGVTRWEYAFEGMLNHIVPATRDGQPLILVSRTTSQQDSILMLSTEGTVLDSVDFSFGRHVLWFQVFNSMIYTLVEHAETGDVRFVGFDWQGREQWSRLLSSGEYETDPVYVPTKKKWFVPLPNGEILVFDLLGNLTDTFSLSIVPTKLFCVETAHSETGTLLIAADGETVSAWKIELQTKD